MKKKESIRDSANVIKGCGIALIIFTFSFSQFCWFLEYMHVKCFVFFFLLCICMLQENVLVKKKNSQFSSS